MSKTIVYHSAINDYNDMNIIVRSVIGYFGIILCAYIRSTQKGRKKLLEYFYIENRWSHSLVFAQCVQKTNATKNRIMQITNFIF